MQSRCENQREELGIPAVQQGIDFGDDSEINGERRLSYWHYDKCLGRRFRTSIIVPHQSSTTK